MTVDDADVAFANKGLAHIHCPICKRLDWTSVSVQPFAVRTPGDRSRQRRPVETWVCCFCGYLRFHVADILLS